MRQKVTIKGDFLSTSSKIYKKKYYLLNKAKIDAENKSNYYASKKDIMANCANCNLEFTTRYKNKKVCSKSCSDKYSKSKRNKDDINAYFRNKYSNDIKRRISSCLRSRLNKALKGNIKSAGTIELLGCSIEELKKHLQSKFTEGMSWENYGQWHIDHVKPLANFDLTNKDEQKQACHYTNLQPLWAEDNISKGSYYEQRIRKRLRRSNS